MNLKDMSKDEAKLWLETEKDRLKKERQENIIKYWNGLTKFEKVSDIPTLPGGIDNDTWKNFYCVKLIECGAIPKKDLKDGMFYLGDHRNAEVARWNASKNEFEHWRTKFSSRYIDNINHFEDDNGYALFVPLKEATAEQFERNAE
jgi:hypothetical protein